MNEKMKAALAETLEPEETVLWESGVQPFAIFDGREGKRILVRWAICFAVAAGMLAACAVNGTGGAGAYATAVCALAIIVAMPIISYRQVLGQRYYITDRRVATINPDGTAYSMNRGSMGEVRLYRPDHGGVALALGSMLLAEKDKQLRWRANHPLESSSYAIEGLVFYRPENAEAAMRLMSGETEA